MSLNFKVTAYYRSIGSHTYRSSISSGLASLAALCWPNLSFVMSLYRILGTITAASTLSRSNMVDLDASNELN